MKAENRKEKIVSIVKSLGYVSTESLVEKFNVSPQTIRRDLNELAEKNVIRRNHGGATMSLSSSNTAYNVRKALYNIEKEHIAKEVVKHIPDGATLFIDIGTTPEFIAKSLLNHKDLKIVTNNLNVAAIFMGKNDFNVILAGGELRHKDGGILGEATLDFVSQFRLDFGILGISGIGLNGALLDFDFHEVRVKKAIMENSCSVILGVDHSKFGRNAMVHLAAIDDVDLIVTDRQPPVEILDIIAESETELVVID